MKRLLASALLAAGASLAYAPAVLAQSLQGSITAVHLDAQPPMLHVSTEQGSLAQIQVEPATRILREGERVAPAELRVGQQVKITTGGAENVAEEVEVLAAPIAGVTRPYRAGDKLVRGLGNFFTGFLEIPRNIHLTTSQENMLKGWTVGLGKGLGFTVLRMGTGIYETLTFPFPLPEGYRPIVRPEYVWQSAGPDYL